MAIKSYLVVEEAIPLSRFSSIVAAKPFVAALAICCLVVKPRVHNDTQDLGLILRKDSLTLDSEWLRVYPACIPGEIYDRRLFCLKVAPLRLSQSRALSMTACIPIPLLLAVGPETHAV
jgi:hypothetical protein